MRRHHFLILLIFFFVACDRTNQVDTQAEEEKIKSLFNVWVKEIGEQESADAFFKYATDDVTLREAGAGPISDHSEIKAAFDSLFKYNSFAVEDYKFEEVIVRDDIAIHKYMATVVLKSKADTTTTAIKLKYLDILKKGEDGTWKVYIHSNSPNE